MNDGSRLGRRPLLVLAAIAVVLVVAVTFLLLVRPVGRIIGPPTNFPPPSPSPSASARVQ